MKQILIRKKLWFLVMVMLVVNAVRAQIVQYPSPIDTAKKNAADTVKKPVVVPSTLTFALDMRTRFEMRHGYRGIPLADTPAAYAFTQRTRFNVDYKSKNLDVFLSLQDARVWGQQDPREGQTGVSTQNTPSSTFATYLFEVYAEPKFGDKFSIRIGRQRVMYDNQRLFAENDWRLPGNSHDAIRVIYNNKINFTTELLGAFGQSGENVFTTKYQPLVSNYKNLVVSYLNWKLTDKFTLTTLNTMDGYQSSDPAKYKTSYQRFTLGGRLEYSTYNWYLTFSGYKQTGKDSSGKKLNAYYMQPEIRYTGGPLTVRLGFEYLSGSDSSTHPSEDKNFVPLYGVAHRFMGNLDLFATFPADVNGAGLFNPYLFIWFQKNKLLFRIENHLFYSQSRFVYKGTPTDKYLGFENDWRLNYKPSKITDLEIGFCWATVTNSMVYIKVPKVASADVDKYSKLPYFAYVSLKLTPTLGKITF
ncbi:MAG TPA: alginate export family protein [Parafilimonas sp.]|nr:alginate export family protein [Parafilimonas sp.]